MTNTNNQEEKKVVNDFFADVLGWDTTKINWKRAEKVVVFGHTNNNHYGTTY